MVANTAIGRWGQNGASLLTFSETMTWKKYINSLMIGTENSPLKVRRKMVQEAFENNPDQVFPDMENMVYKRYWGVGGLRGLRDCAILDSLAEPKP